MNKIRKSTVPVNILALLMIALVAFKDTGIFIQDFLAKQADTSVQFQKGEEVNIGEETESDYIIEKDGADYKIPKENILETTKTGNKYELVVDTPLKGVKGELIRWVRKSEEVELINLEGTKGLFKTLEGSKGYLELKDLKKKKQEVLTPGISRIDRSLKNGENTLNIKKGEAVNIKNFDGENYILVDNNGNEYKIEHNYIKARGKVGSSRGLTIPKEEKKENNKGKQIVDAAHKQLGKPYVGGDTGRRGFDCSGLTYYLYSSELGVTLPRSSGAQASVGKAVSRSELQPGDLVFFRTSGRNIAHVGVYVGNNQMIHASTSRRSMIKASINCSYFGPRYVTARRIVD